MKIDSATIANEKVKENLEFSEKYSISQLLPDSRKSKTRSFQRSQSLRLTKVLREIEIWNFNNNISNLGALAQIVCFRSMD